MPNSESEVKRVTETQPLLKITRGAYVDAVHSGHLVVVRSDGQVAACAGYRDYPAVLRSGMKPLQLLGVIASGAVERFGFEDRELAVAASSHSGEAEHVDAVRSMLNKIGMGESDLRCGVHPPFMPHVAADMARAGVQPSPIHNNCSGKHTSMLAACLARGWPTEDYIRLEHPLQQDNLHRLARFASVDIDEVGIVIDGCGIPAYVLPLSRSALAFARLAEDAEAPSEDRDLIPTAWRAITANPEYGSGRTGRLEAVLMRLGGGKLIAKVGAEGFYAVGIAPGVIGESGYGLALKLEEGITFNRATDPIVVAALRQIGALPEDAHGELEPFSPRAITNCRNEVAGGMEVLFELRADQ